MKGGLSSNYEIKKQEYLQMTLSQEKGYFIDNFYTLYNSGAWVFEPRLPKIRPSSQVINNDLRPIKDGNYIQESTAQ